MAGCRFTFIHSRGLIAEDLQKSYADPTPLIVSIACEWKAHRKQQVHQDWVRAQPGKRKLEELPSSSRYAAKVKNISLDWSGGDLHKA